MEWPAQTTLGALAVEPVGLDERVGVHRDRRVDTLLVEGDANEVGLDQLAARDPSFLHGALHLGDRGLDDVEIAVLRRCDGARGQQQEKAGPGGREKLG